LKSAGTQSLSVIDLATGIRATVSFNVVAAPTKLVISGILTTIKVSFDQDLANLDFAVTSTDYDGNRVGSYAGMVHFTATDGVSLEIWDYTFTGADQGSHYFKGTSDFGRQSIRVVDTSDLTVSGSVGFRVVQLPPPRGVAPRTSTNGGKNSVLPSTTIVELRPAEKVMLGAGAAVHTTIGISNAGVVLPLLEDAWVQQFFAHISSTNDQRLVLPHSRPRVEDSEDVGANDAVCSEGSMLECAVLLAWSDQSVGIDFPIGVSTGPKVI
jgi:hypothetical protein